MSTVLVSLAGLAICFSGNLTPRESSKVVLPPAIVGSCVDRYDYLLIEAKAALMKDDRGASVELLKEAQNIIPRCPALQDGVPQQTALLDPSNSYQARLD